MKAYVYSDSEIQRVSRFTQAEIERARVRIAPPFEHTENSCEADFFWFPIDLGHWEAYHGGVHDIARGVLRLSHWPGNGNRHVFYFCSDGPDPIGIPSIIFRQSFWKNRKDSHTIAWPYAVEDFGDLITGDFDSLPYDVSFVGSRVSHKSRIESFDSVLNTTDLASFMYDSHVHWGSVEHTEVGKLLKEKFKNSMAQSKMILAARGGGLSCYRFFEAMSAGRVPILLADDWELPHQDLIDWDKCILQISEKDAHRAGPILLNNLRLISNNTLAAMGLYGQSVWQAYLKPDVWPEMMEWYIKKALI